MLILTPQEINVLQMLGKGMQYKEIAKQKEVKIDTIKKHCTNIYKKLHVRNKTEALAKYLALQQGINTTSTLNTTFGQIQFNNGGFNRF